MAAASTDEDATSEYMEPAGPVEAAAVKRSRTVTVVVNAKDICGPALVQRMQVNVYGAAKGPPEPGCIAAVP